LLSDAYHADLIVDGYLRIGPPASREGGSMRRTTRAIPFVILWAMLAPTGARAATHPVRPARPESPLAGPSWRAEGNQASANLGSSVARAGDVNGDGYDDVIVGADKYDGGQTDEGRALVYYGSASGLATTAAWTAESDQADASFGYSVAGAGDVNGDGYDDVIVGALLFDNGETTEGRAFAYYGSASGLSTTPNWTAESDQADAAFGVSVASAGDVNGDGYDDVIVGADQYTHGQTFEGRAYVYLGSATGLKTTSSWTGEGDQSFAFYGISVGTAGDVNGDGYDDVIVGADDYDDALENQGMAFAYYGSAAGLSTTARWRAEVLQDNAFFGHSVGTAGDVNGDGYDDVVVGANEYSNGQSGEGRAFLYNGSPTGLSVTASWGVESNQVAANFGESVASAGDFNGDGFGDVIVGAPGATHGQTNEGQAFLFKGSASGLSTKASFVAESNQAEASLGSAVASAGDFNGDGFDDLIVGAPDGDHGETDEGFSFAYRGRLLA
jgi:hypothetical protein